MTKGQQLIDSTNVFSEIKPKLFWSKLGLGTLSGAAAYFLLRFGIGWTFYIMALILYTVSIFSILTVIVLLKSDFRSDMKQVLRFALSYTAVWLMMYFIAGTICFWFGW